MQIILLIPVETRLSLEQTDPIKCVKDIWEFICMDFVGPIQTLRSLMQPLAFWPDVLAPE